MKTCSKCGIEKPLIAFHSAPNKDGYSGQCADCRCAYNKSLYDLNRQKRRENQRRYYHANKDAERERSLKKYTNPKQRMNQIVSRFRRKAISESRLFDLTKEYLLVLMAAQNGRCALTGIEFDYSNPTNGDKRNPFGPSLDRINSSQDYTMDNVQFVCWIVNAAKNEYNVEIFDAVCRARVRMLDNGA